MKPQFITTRAEFQKSGRRGNATQVATVLVGGRYFTYAALGEGLGVTKEEANRRYSNARRRGVWPITMKDLEEK